MDRNQEQVPAGIYLFLEPEWFGINFLFTRTGIPKGSDYFTEKFQVKENKMKMRNIHPNFFHLFF